VVRTLGYSHMPERMHPENPQQLTLFVIAVKDISFGVGVAWMDGSGWKTKAWSLGKYLTESDAVLFGINMVTKNLLSIIKGADHCCAEIVTKSRVALIATNDARQWALPAITHIKRQIRRVEDEGGRVVLTWLSDDGNEEGYRTAKAVAQRAAKQQPKEMRSASLSYAKQAAKEAWKPTTKFNKHIADAKKSFSARYLQLKSGHAVTGVHLLRIGKVQDAHCWWCGNSRQTVMHLMLSCRRWRRERDTMLQELRIRRTTAGEMQEQTHLKTLFEKADITEVLRFIESTEVGKRRTTDNPHQDDLWDVERLDSSNEGETVGNGGV
jgi:hypothetical protein